MTVRDLCRHKPETIILVLIILAGMLLRFHGLGRESFWFNEAASYYYAKGTLWQTILHSFRDETNPPGFHLVIHFWKCFAGITEPSLRIPSAVMGSASILLMYMFARRFLRQRGALIATGFLAFAPLHVWYSQECRGFAFLTFFILAGYTSALLWLETGHRRYLIINVLSLLLAVSFHYFGVHALLIQNFYILLTRPAIFRSKWRSWATSQFILIIGLIPFGLMILSVDPTNVQWWKESGIHFGVFKSLLFHLNGVYFLLSKERAVKVAILLLNGFFFLAGCITFRRDKRLIFPLLATGLPVLLNLFYSLFISPIIGNPQSVGRYFLFTLPPFLLLIALGWDRALKSIRFRTFATATLITFSFFYIYAFSAIWRNTVFQRDDNRRLCSILFAKAQPGDLVIVSPFITLDYYMDRLGYDRNRLRILTLPRFEKDFPRYLPKEINRTWMFVDPVHHFEPLLEEVKKRYSLRITSEEIERKLSGVGLFLLEREGKKIK